MRRIIVLLLSGLVALGLVAGPGAAAQAQPRDHTHGIHGVVLTTATIVPPAVQVAGQGVVSRMGLVRTTSTQTLSGNPLDPRVGDVITSDDLVIRAADGDLLYADYQATITMAQLPRIAFAGTIPFTGGTGRFAGASGEADTAGGFDFQTMRGSFTVDGAITLPRS